jgi:arylsulfatase A-like enzyme
MNVVVMVLDTLRYDVVHHTAREAGIDAYVPNMDALRREAISFSAAFGEGEPTIPTRRCLWTGVRSFPWRYDFDTRGLWPTPRGWHKIPPEQPTLSETLLARGYKTALIADVYHMFKPTLNFTRGWLSWEFIRGQESDNWQAGPLSLIREEAERCVKGGFNPAEHAVLAQYLLNKRVFSREEPLTSGIVFKRAIEWLRLNHADGPFLLWIEAFDPHEPWDPPRQYADRYCPDFEGTEFIFPPAAARVGTEREKERTKALYLGEVTYMDEWVGRLMNELADLGRLDDTIVMLLSDHGTELLDHGEFGKRANALYAHNTQLVWIVRHPGLSAGRGKTVDAFVMTQDVVPTILDMLDVPAPELPEADRPLAGRSVLPLLRAAAGETAGLEESIRRAREGRDYAITGWGDWAAVRSKDWNYIVNFERPDENPRLFDLRADPAEQRNVISEHPQVAAEYRRRLERFLGQELPARLPDRFEPSQAPCRVYYRSQASRLMQESGFV